MTDATVAEMETVNAPEVYRLTPADVRRAVLAERERCAQIVENMPAHTWHDGSDQYGQPCPAKVITTKADYVAAIRKG